MPVVIATQEADIRTSSKKTLHKKKAGGVAQGVGPEFKPQYHKINKDYNKRGHI
jgi:hypothetical protein